MKRKVGREWVECGPAAPVGCGLMGEAHSNSGDALPMFNLSNSAHKPMGQREASELPTWVTPVTMGFYEKLRRRDLTSGVE